MSQDTFGETVTGLSEFVVPGNSSSSSYSPTPVRLPVFSLPSANMNKREQQRHNKEEDGAGQKALAAILQRNRGLRYVSIAGNMLSDGGRREFEEVGDALSPGLEHLVIRGWVISDDDSDQSDPNSDNDSTANIIDHGDLAEAPLPPMPPRSLIPIPQLPCLRRLDIIHCRVPDCILNELLRCCGNNLDTLCIFKDRGSSTSNLSSSIRDNCPRLAGLVVLQWYPNSDREIADLIDASRQGWKTLCIPVGHHSIPCFGPLATEALLKHSATLENLRLEGHKGFGSRAIQKLLSSAPHLRRFAGVGRDRYYGRSLQLDARDIGVSPWICLSLESLKIQICSVPRPDVARRTNGRPFPKKRPSSAESTRLYNEDVQLKVYDQLGQLTRLKELVLGKDDVDLLEEVRIAEEENEGEFYDSGGEEDNGVQTGYQYDCLDMSVQSGMDRMQRLKGLRSVVVEGMTTQFWKEEQQSWVKAHWPRVLTSRHDGNSNVRYKDPFWLQYGIPEYL